MSYAYAPWHLRSYKRLQVFNDHLSESSPNQGPSSATDADPAKHTQPALEIFCKGNTKATRRTGLVDGVETTFELRENVTKERPKTSREERLKRNITLVNNQRSSWDLRCRWWLMEYQVTSLTLMYMVVFLSLNFVFAGLWMIQEGKCCGEPNSYVEVFDFAIQTSTTIGYGGYVPVGRLSNFFVVMLTFATVFLNAIYGGLLVMKFVSPSGKIRFSEVMTYSNVNGLPCLEVRVGNEDGLGNPLLNAEVRMTYTVLMEYRDEAGELRNIGQTNELKLLSDKRASLGEYVWTLRHIVDENSPLFGLDILKPPGSYIAALDVAIQVTQKTTGAPVFAHAGYQIEDIMIGHRFVDQITYDEGGIPTRTGTIDYVKFDETVPEYVWYKSGVA